MTVAGVAGKNLSERGVINLTPARQGNLRLFCFPFAGGTANNFRWWIKHLPENDEVYAMQLPGRGARLQETPYDAMHQVTRELLPAIIQRLDKPVVFFGHSMGAAVAYQLSVELQEIGAPLPAYLFFSGSAPISLHNSGRRVHAFDEKELMQELKALGGTPPDILENPDFLRYYIPGIKADFKVLENFVPLELKMLYSPFTVWGGLSDYRVPVEMLQGWSRFSHYPIKIRKFQGGHMFIDQQQSGLECLQDLAETLSGIGDR